jgi:DNA replication protein DnaC
MTEEIQQLLHNLRLRKMAEMVEEELAAARKTSPSYTDLLARLLRAEWLDQQERRLQARIKQAHLPEQWTLESFPFKQQLRIPGQPDRDSEIDPITIPKLIRSRFRDEITCAPYGV